MSQVASNAHRVEVIASGGNALASLAQTMQPGTWATLNTLRFRDASITYGNVLKGYYGSSGNFITQYAVTCSWEPISQCVVFLGANHGVPNLGDRLSRFIRYKVATNIWENIYDDPGLLPAPPNGYPEGFGHAYYHNSATTLNGISYVALYGFRFLMRFNSVTSQWLANTPEHAAPTQISFGVAIHPNLGSQGSVILFDGDFGPHRYDIATNTWSYYSWTAGIAGPYHVGAWYNPAVDCVFFGGGNGSKAIWKLTASNVMTRINDAPDYWGVNAGSSSLSGCVQWIDPATGKDIFLFPAPTNEGTMYSRNPVTDTWTLLSNSLRPPWLPGGVDGAVFGTIATTLPQYGVAFVVNYDGTDGTNSQVYLYKHNGT